MQYTLWLVQYILDGEDTSLQVPAPSRYEAKVRAESLLGPRAHVYRVAPAGVVDLEARGLEPMSRKYARLGEVPRREVPREENP